MPGNHLLVLLKAQEDGYLVKDVTLCHQLSLLRVPTCVSVFRFKQELCMVLTGGFLHVKYNGETLKDLYVENPALKVWLNLDSFSTSATVLVIVNGLI